MLTPVERVLILKNADLLKEAGPRHLLGLANVAREVPVYPGDTIYMETDDADALYIVVEGRVRLREGDRTMSEVGPGEAFGTWSLVDDSARGHRAECVEDGLLLALHRDDFYDVAAADLALLKELVRVLAKRLRALAAERPQEEARVEGEGVERPEAQVEAEERAAAAASAAGAEETPPEGARGAVAEPGQPAAPGAGAALAAAATGKPSSAAAPPEAQAAAAVTGETPAPLDPVLPAEPITPDLADTLEEPESTPGPP